MLNSTGNGREAVKVIEAGLERASTVGYTPALAQLAFFKAYRLFVSGRASEAIPFTAEVMSSAQHADDEVGYAQMLMWHGDARVATGDLAGIEEMRTAVSILADHSHPWACGSYLNLAENLVALGDFRAAADARGLAQATADRFGRAYHVGYAHGALADSAYHRGQKPLISPPKALRIATGRSRA